MHLSYKKILEWSVDHLTKAGINQPESDAKFLFQRTFANNGKQFFHKEIVCNETIDRFKSYIERRASREPIPYILGFCEFWSLDFQVTPDVLIPRRETEVLIKHFLKFGITHTHPIRVMDLCTGSGIIAIVVAKEIYDSEIVAVDISIDALKVAKKNTLTHQVSEQIYFLQSDLFKNIQFEDLGLFDYILSNPPYINPKLFQNLAPEMMQYEPNLAINGGRDGLKFYRSIIQNAADFLKPSGYLILEFGFGLCQMIEQIIRDIGKFYEPQTVKDFNGILRVISVQKKR